MILSFVHILDIFKYSASTDLPKARRDLDSFLPPRITVLEDNYRDDSSIRSD